MANTLILDSLQFTIDSIKFAEAEKNYHEFLSSGGSRVASAPASSAGAEGSESFSLSQQVKLAREQIQSSLKQQRKSPLNTTGGVDPEDEAMLREENLRLKKNVEDLQSQLQKLTDRVAKLELTVGTNAPTSAGDSNKKPTPPAADDDDVDLFGSDEEEDEEAAKIREQRLAEYANKKSKKTAVIAKSNVILDVKPWDDETDMKELEREVRKITMEGLLWGVSKLVPVGYGINKLQIATVIEDDKVSVDELTEKIQDLEDFVQSVDIAAFNKI
jgi:elongation factor 1-delta